SSRASFFRRPPLTPAGRGRRRKKDAPPLHPHVARWAALWCRKRFRSAGVQLGSGARPERPSIRGRPATLSSTFYRVPVARPARHQQGPTHRTNGAFTGSPGGTTAAPTDLAYSTSAAAATPPATPGSVRFVTRDRALR